MNFPRSTCTDIYIFPWQVDVLHVKKMVAGLEDVWIIQDLVLREWFICRGLGDCRTAYFKWRKIAQDRFSSMWSESLTPCPGRSAFYQHSGARSYERQDHNTLLFFLNILRFFQRPFLACLFFFSSCATLTSFFFFFGPRKVFLKFISRHKRGGCKWWIIGPDCWILFEYLIFFL